MADEEDKENQFYMDGYLKSNLDLAKKAILDDWDMLLVVDGPEGSGKSMLALQVASYLDPTFEISRITFSPTDFKEAILNTGKYKAVILDEAYQGLSSRGAMTEINRGLVSMLAEIRQKNLFILLVLPSFFDLDRYAALWRSRALLHCYTHKMTRGRFAFFNYDKKKRLYIEGKKFYSYSKPNANFYGRFTKHYPINEQEYKDKKLEALQRYSEANSKEKVDKYRERLFGMLDYLTENRIIPQKDMAKATKMEIQAIKDFLYRERSKVDSRGESINTYGISATSMEEGG